MLPVGPLDIFLLRMSIIVLLLVADGEDWVAVHPNTIVSPRLSCYWTLSLNLVTPTLLLASFPLFQQGIFFSSFFPGEYYRSFHGEDFST